MMFRNYVMYDRSVSDNESVSSMISMINMWSEKFADQFPIHDRTIGVGQAKFNIKIQITASSLVIHLNYFTLYLTLIMANGINYLYRENFVVEKK